MCELCSCTLEQKKQVITDAINIGFSARNQEIELAMPFCEQASKTLYGEHSPLAHMCFAATVYGYHGVKAIEMFETDQDFIDLWNSVREQVTMLKMVATIKQAIEKMSGE